MPTRKIHHPKPSEHLHTNGVIIALTAVTFVVILIGFFLTLPWNYRTQRSDRPGFGPIWENVEGLGTTIGDGLTRIRGEIQKINTTNTNASDNTAQDQEKERRMNRLEEKVFDNIDRTR
jgi:hypothetical protein